MSSLPPIAIERIRLSKLTGEKVLILSNLGLTKLPNQLFELKHLEVLDLSANKLEEIPEGLLSLDNLSTLILSKNRLRTIPASIGKLKSLKHLDLRHNRLVALPETLKLLSLQSLKLNGNALLDLPLELLGSDAPSWSIPARGNQEPATLLEFYFFARTRPLGEVKLLLLGRAEGGKTAIRNRLVHDTFAPSSAETLGIDIAHWPIRVDGVEINVHVWDFAGQEITHHTHQFFLTERSIYILVLTGRSDEQDRDAEYWLRLIQSFAKQSPVIVVLNKWDSRPFSIDSNALKERFPSIKGFISTDCKSGLGITELRRAITQAIAEQQDIFTPFPGGWWDVKQYFAQASKDYIAFSEFRKTCERLGVSRSDEQEQLAYVLHSLGIVLYYGNDFRLRETAILNPRWVTTGIYKILRLGQQDSTCTSGVITLAEAKQAIPEEPEHMVQYLLGLMRRFELCYPYNEDDNAWLVPELLPPHAPDLGPEWKAGESTRLRYRYSVLPQGIMPRLIVRTFPLSKDECRWRRGVVLSLEGARALIRCDYFENRISVEVIGERSSRLRLVKSIRGHFTSIHETIRGLTPREEIEVEQFPGLFKDVQILEYDERKSAITTIETDEGSVTIEQTRELDRISLPSARRSKLDGLSVFVGYARKDTQVFELFRQHLEILRTDGLIRQWFDGCTGGDPESEWEIRYEIEKADVIVLFVSTAFLASKYLRSQELALAASRSHSDEVVLVPVILESNCAWESVRKVKVEGMSHDITIDLKLYNPILPDGKGVRDWGRYGNAFGYVEEKMRRILQERLKKVSNE